jgi:hypothetical protein
MLSARNASIAVFLARTGGVNLLQNSSCIVFTLFTTIFKKRHFQPRQRRFETTWDFSRLFSPLLYGPRPLVIRTRSASDGVRSLPRWRFGLVCSPLICHLGMFNRRARPPRVRKRRLWISSRATKKSRTNGTVGAADNDDRSRIRTSGVNWPGQLAYAVLRVIRGDFSGRFCPRLRQDFLAPYFYYDPPFQKRIDQIGQNHPAPGK